MNTPKTLEDELLDQLRDLQTDVKDLRMDQANPNIVQKRMDKFLIDWSAKLIEERDNQTKDVGSLAPRVHPEAREAGSVQEVRDVSRMVITDVKKANAGINDRVSHLREVMIASVQDIDKGREPNLSKLMSPPMEKENAEPSTWESKLRAGKLTPERVKELMADIAAQRKKEKSLNLSPDIER